MDRRSFLNLLGAAGLVYRSPALSAELPPRSTGLVFDQRYLQYRFRNGDFEAPRRLSALREKLHRTGLLQRLVLLAPADPSTADIELVHTSAHRAAIEALGQTAAAARLAVGGVLAGVKAVAEGKVRNVFCAVRPPGHHASNTGREEGFCYYNNVAVAARYAQRVLGYRRVCIIDWDFHHGNGTEALFRGDPSVLYFSTHHGRAYPGTGGSARRISPGGGGAVGVDLRCGSGEREIARAWDKLLVPLLDTFSPDFFFVSAGFDSRKGDPLGCFSVTDIGYLQLTRKVAAMADARCGGRVVSVLEGGYDPHGLAEAVAAHVQGLLGT